MILLVSLCKIEHSKFYCYEMNRYKIRFMQKNLSEIFANIMFNAYIYISS